MKKNELLRKTIEDIILYLGVAFMAWSLWVLFRLRNSHGGTQAATTLMIIGAVALVVGVAMKVAGFTRRNNAALLDNSSAIASANAENKCPKCGLEVFNGVKVCPNCGTSIEIKPTIDISEFIKRAECGGRRTVVAVPISGDMVEKQQRAEEYLFQKGYRIIRSSTGEIIWAKETYMIKCEFISGFALISGFLNYGGSETNLEGSLGAVPKREVLKTIQNLRERIV